jgi:phosphoglycerate dehydrogenase-like enzyme
LPQGHPFYAHARIRLTPHCSWSADDTTERIMRRLFTNIDRHLAGLPLEDRVEPLLGY